MAALTNRYGNGRAGLGARRRRAAAATAALAVVALVAPWGVTGAAAQAGAEAAKGVWWSTRSIATAGRGRPRSA